MKLVDLVHLSGDRLRDPGWLDRLSLPRVRGCFCLFLCADVAGALCHDRGELPLAAGKTLVLAPSPVRSLQVEATGPKPFVGAVFFELSPQEPLHGIARFVTAQSGPEPPEGARAFFASLNEHFVSGSVFRLQAAAHQAAAYLYTLAEKNAEGGPEDKGQAHVEKALGLMHLNADSAMSLSDISAALRLSEAYFIRLFKKVMHMPPMKYFTRLKIHNAALLLMRGLTVKEVATKLGFYSESHFSRQFKHYMGVPPKSYKPDYIEALENRYRESERSIVIVSAALSRYIDSVADMVFVKDTAFIYRGCNAAFCRYAGKKKEDIFGNTDFTLFPPDIAAFYRERDERIFTTRQAIINEEWVTYPDGARELVEVSKSPYFGPDGELLGMIGISRVISSRAAMGG